MQSDLRDFRAFGGTGHEKIFLSITCLTSAGAILCLWTKEDPIRLDSL